MLPNLEKLYVPKLESSSGPKTEAALTKGWSVFSSSRPCIPRVPQHCYSSLVREQVFKTRI